MGKGWAPLKKIRRRGLEGKCLCARKEPEISGAEKGRKVASSVLLPLASFRFLHDEIFPANHGIR